jgi:hypothetical protein
VLGVTVSSNKYRLAPENLAIAGERGVVVSFSAKTAQFGPLSGSVAFLPK